MKDLSIAQEYMICTVNEKGAIAGYNQKAVACLVVSGLLEMQLAKCIALNDKKVSVCSELPENMTYLKPLYNIINQGKPMKVEKVVETYTIAFTNKKLYELEDALMESLKEADVVEALLIQGRSARDVAAEGNLDISYIYKLQKKALARLKLWFEFADAKAEL